MNKSKSFILLAVVAGVLILGVAYAAIQDITLNVSGTASSDVTDDATNFNVEFTAGTVTAGKEGTTVSGSVDTSAKRTADVTITGLKEIGDSAVVELTIANQSTDLEAILNGSATALATSLSGDDADYFSISEATFGAVRLGVKGESDATTTLTFTVTLEKASVSGKTCNISASFAAAAVDPE